MNCSQLPVYHGAHIQYADIAFGSFSQIYFKAKQTGRPFLGHPVCFLCPLLPDPVPEFGLALKKLEDKRMDVAAFLETVRRSTDATTVPTHGCRAISASRFIQGPRGTALPIRGRRSTIITITASALWGADRRPPSGTFCFKIAAKSFLHILCCSTVVFSKGVRK